MKIIGIILSCFVLTSYGELTREIYRNISSQGVHLIKSHSNFPWNPDTLDTISDFEFGPSIGDNYGARVLGYITIPESASYTFHLACDDHGELNISFDGSVNNLQTVAHVKGWTQFKNFSKYESQTSSAFNLTAGQILYVEAFVKEGGGGDHLAVAWSKDGGAAEVITSEHLSPFVYNFADQQAVLANTIQLAQSLYDQSASNIGTEQGQFSDSSRVNFQVAIEAAQSLLDTESESGRTLAKAVYDLDQATEIFTGGIKPTKILGVPFGTTPAWYSSRSFDKAHDGDINTFFDFLLNNGGHTGIEIPDGRETAVLAVRYHPRSTSFKRMVGGKFQGSVDGLSYTTFHTISEEPTFKWYTVTVDDPTVYKYLRYVGPNNSHCNIAELEFLGLQNQELFMLNHEIISVKANTADQALSSDSVKAEHGGLLPNFITYKVLELPSKGELKLGDTALAVDSIFTQEDLNNEQVSFSSDSSRESDSFKVEVRSSVGGILPEVIIDLKVDSDFDGLSDQQEITLGTDFDNADTNNNGIDDFWEHENGLDPIADTLSPLVSNIEGENGLSASYYFGRFSKTTDFSSRSPMKVTKVSSINFGNTYWGEFANSGKVHNVGAKFTGYLYVPIAGNYKFILSSDDGSKLFINGIQVITNDGLHSYKQVEGVINLSAGFHKIRCDYFEAGGNHGCILQWEGPARARQVIPASHFFLSLPEHEALEKSIDSDQDFLTDEQEAIEGTDPHNPDSDGDKLLDGEEYLAAYGYKTNPMNVDTDGDTVSDYDEIFIFNSNPLVPDFDGTVTDEINIIPKDTLSRLGQWEEDGDKIYSQERRGAVEYEFTVVTPGFYRLDSLIAQKASEASNDIMDVRLYVDGEYVSRQKTDVSSGSQNVSWLTTYMNAGTHKIKFFWDNVYYGTNLEIQALRLYRPGGPDENSNGRPDWMDTYLNNTYSLDAYEATSKASPAQIEGKGRYVSKIGVSLGVPVERGTHNRWFSDIPLKKDGPTEFDLEFEQGLDSKSGSITWEETNVLDEGSIAVRKGSSMLLNAVIDGDIDSSATITIGENTFDVAPEAPLEYKFEEAGTFEVTAEYLGSQNLTKTLTVKVIGVEETDSPFIWRSKPRFWNWPNLAEEVVLQAEGMELTPTTDGYTLRRTEVLEKVNIVARLGISGPIIASLPTKAFWLRDVVEGFVVIVEVLEDGTKITNDTVFGMNLPEGISINVNTISGVTFPDGSRTKTITKDDFDELNQWTIELIKSVDRTGASCHWYKVYQNGIFVGQQNK